jgi:hypothetical protein
MSFIKHSNNKRFPLSLKCNPSTKYSVTQFWFCIINDHKLIHSINCVVVSVRKERETKSEKRGYNK